MAILHFARRATYISKSTYSQEDTDTVQPLRSLYVDTTAPSSLQLSAASLFFSSHTTLKAWTGFEWRNNSPFPKQSTNNSRLSYSPEIVFLGRSNTGKSSLLNALVNDPDLCRVGSKPGKTQTLHAWHLLPTPSKHSRARSSVQAQSIISSHPDVGDQHVTKLTVVDMPGYGYGSHSEWGQEIMTYLRRRRQLKRAFLLLNPEHGLKTGDEQVLDFLRTLGVSHQIVACKTESTSGPQLRSQLMGLRDTVRESEEQQKITGVSLGDVLAVGGLGYGKDSKRFRQWSETSGVDEVRWSILRAVGLEEHAVRVYEDFVGEKARRLGSAGRDASRRPEKLSQYKQTPSTASSSINVTMTPSST